MYYYDLLTTFREKRLYRKICTALRNRAARISVGNVGPQEINAVLRAILMDHPEIFWFEGKWRLEKKGDAMEKIKPEEKGDAMEKTKPEEKGDAMEKTKQGANPVFPNSAKEDITYVEPFYLYDSAQIAEAWKVISACALQFEQKRTKSDGEKARMVYDWLLDHVSYGMSDTEGQNLYDALGRRRAVCKGLSKAYQYLLTELGMFVTLVEGTLDGRTKHVWNIVDIDHSFYHVDVAMGYRKFDFLFDKTNEANRYRCFAVSDEAIQKTHRILYPQDGAFYEIRIAE